jgi:hypothetical protein
MQVSQLISQSVSQSVRLEYLKTMCHWTKFAQAAAMHTMLLVGLVHVGLTTFPFVLLAGLQQTVFRQQVVLGQAAVVPPPYL